MLRLILILFVVLPLAAQTDYGSGAFRGTQDFLVSLLKLPKATVATLPTASENADVVFRVTDASTPGSCNEGGGSSEAFCVSNGTSWVSLGDGGGSGSEGPEGPEGPAGPEGTANKVISGTGETGTFTHNFPDPDRALYFCTIPGDEVGQRLPYSGFSKSYPDVNTVVLNFGANIDYICSMNASGGGGGITISGTDSQADIIHNYPDPDKVHVKCLTGDAELVKRQETIDANTIRLYFNSSVPYLCSTVVSGSSDGSTGGGGEGGGLEDPGSSGLLVRTALNTTITRSVDGVTNETAVTNGTGVGGNPQVGIASVFRITGKTATAPFKVGSTNPGTCTVGDMFFNTSATDGQNVFGCTATNTWTLQGDGGEGGGGGGSPGGSTNAVQYKSGSTTFGGVALNSTSTPKVLVQVNGTAPTLEEISVDMIPSVFPGMLEGTFGHNFPSISAGLCSQQSFTMTGALTGTSGVVAVSNAFPVGINVQPAKVTALDTVVVEICNNTASSYDPAPELSYTVTLLGSAYR